MTRGRVGSRQLINPHAGSRLRSPGSTSQCNRPWSSSRLFNSKVFAALRTTHCVPARSQDLGRRDGISTLRALGGQVEVGQFPHSVDLKRGTSTEEKYGLSHLSPVYRRAGPGLRCAGSQRDHGAGKESANGRDSRYQLNQISITYDALSSSAT